MRKYIEPFVGKCGNPFQSASVHKKINFGYSFQNLTLMKPWGLRRFGAESSTRACKGFYTVISIWCTCGRTCVWEENEREKRLNLSGIYCTSCTIQHCDLDESLGLCTLTDTKLFRWYSLTLLVGVTQRWETQSYFSALKLVLCPNICLVLQD